MTRVALIGLLVAGVALGSPVAGAKKKVKRVGPAEATLSANQAIPDAVPFGGPGVLRSPITVGQRFKGRTIADVNVTVQTTGATAMAAEGLAIRLTSPRETAPSWWRATARRASPSGRSPSTMRRRFAFASIPRPPARIQTRRPCSQARRIRPASSPSSTAVRSAVSGR